MQSSPTSLQATPLNIYTPPSRGTLVWRYLRRNKGILTGLSILAALALFVAHGMFAFTVGRGLRLTDRMRAAYPLADKPRQPPYFATVLCTVGLTFGCDTEKAISGVGASPSSKAGDPTPAPSSGDIGALPGIGGTDSGDIGALPGIDSNPASDPGAASDHIYWLGTDWYGRDLHAAMALGLWQTALIGVFAGLIATLIPVILGFLAAYFGGMLDRGITGMCSVLQPIPPFLIQVILAASLPRNELFSDDKPFQTIAIIGGIVAITAWMKPTLVIRSQVLSMKERMFVNVAKLSGMGSWDIIFKELLPNLLPFIVASFVNAIFDALFISFGLSVLGLAPLTEPLLGNIIYFAQQQSAIFNGWWWWPMWPVLALLLIFGALTLINTGLDEVANPRARRSE